jgi:hypothetical protein
MSRMLEQGWAARPFSEQFPELTNDDAKRLDNLNAAVTDLSISNLLTPTEYEKIRRNRFPKLVKKLLKKSSQ